LLQKRKYQTSDFLYLFPTTTIQRFGYLLDEVLEYKEKAKILLERVKQSEIKFRKSLLKSEVQSVEISDYEQNKV